MKHLLSVTAPCRIDFAGGTLDLWPLPAMIAGAVTLNHAVSLRVELGFFERSEGERSRIVSADQGLELLIEDPAPELDEGPLALFAHAFRACPPRVPIELRITSPVPKGSGLGASSTLLIATLEGLFALRGESPAEAIVVALARDLEARHIGVPTGTQDYWAALRGGLNIISYGPGQAVGAPRRDAALGPALEAFLGEHLLLLFTGEAHFSAAPNWAMLKAFIEEPEIRPVFDEIKAAALDAVAAVGADEPAALASAMRREWSARKRLSEAVLPARIGAVMERLEQSGALAMKLCGAGGGGSMICLVPPEQRSALVEVAQSHGFSVLEGTLEVPGVAVEVGQQN